MSPIGRVFIILNLVLAGGFVAVSGTHLQQQHNYKTQLQQEQEARTKEVGEKNRQIADLTTERNNFENAKTANERKAEQLEVRLTQAEDENKRLSQTLAQFEGDIKTLVAANSSTSAEVKSAFDQAKMAFAQSQADQKTKDEAVSAKNTAEAENRELKNTIAANLETIKTKELEIADLTKDRSELRLLVAVAEANGFKPSMAAPNLSGLVTTASGRLCTIQITDNPGNVDINEQIQRGKWGFAIYDGTTYKGEAIATKYEASANAVLCNIYLVKGEIKEGDRASTKTP